MKKLMMAALIMVGSVAFADGGSWGTEDVIAAGGLNTVVGGCQNATIINNGENTEIVYTGPCNSQKAQPVTVTSCSNQVLWKKFATSDQAYAHCSQFSSGFISVGVTYDYGYKAYTCSCYENQNGGN